MFRRTLKLASLTRNYATESVRENAVNNLKNRMKMMQIEEGSPVHLKKGLFDTLLFQLTAIGCIVGSTSSIYMAISMAFKKK